MMRYIYFRKNKENHSHDGIVCVGYKYNERDKNIDYVLGFCSPKDNFSKKKARFILDGRMIKNKKYSFGFFELEPKYIDVVKFISEEIKNLKEYNQNEFPHWFKELPMR